MYLRVLCGEQIPITTHHQLFLDIVTNNVIGFAGLLIRFFLLSFGFLLLCYFLLGEVMLLLDLEHGGEGGTISDQRARGDFCADDDDHAGQNDIQVAG